jgi:hypothetical protein
MRILLSEEEKKIRNVERCRKYYLNNREKVLAWRRKRYRELKKVNKNPINPERKAYYDRLWYEESVRKYHIAKANQKWLRRGTQRKWVKDLSPKPKISIEELGYFAGDRFARW